MQDGQLTSVLAGGLAGLSGSSLQANCQPELMRGEKLGVAVEGAAAGFQVDRRCGLYRGTAAPGAAAAGVLAVVEHALREPELIGAEERASSCHG